MSKEGRITLIKDDASITVSREIVILGTRHQGTVIVRATESWVQDERYDAEKLFDFLQKNVPGQTYHKLFKLMVEHHRRIKGDGKMKNNTEVYGEGYVAGYNQARVDMGTLSQAEADTILLRIGKELIPKETPARVTEETLEENEG